MDELYKTMVKTQVTAIEEVLKKLISITGIDTNTINAQNINETRTLMEKRGYRIEHESNGDKTTYELYFHDKMVCSARIWTEYSNENGQYIAVVKHQLFPNFTGTTESPSDSGSRIRFRGV